MNTEPGLQADGGERDQTAGEEKLGSTFHLHLMAATTDTLHCLSMPPLSVRLYHQANVNMCVMTLLGPLHHATFVFLCLLESALKIPLNLL